MHHHDGAVLQVRSRQDGVFEPERPSVLHVQKTGLLLVVRHEGDVLARYGGVVGNAERIPAAGRLKGLAGYVVVRAVLVLGHGILEERIRGLLHGHRREHGEQQAGGHFYVHVSLPLYDGLRPIQRRRLLVEEYVLRKKVQ